MTTLFVALMRVASKRSASGTLYLGSQGPIPRYCAAFRALVVVAANFISVEAPVRLAVAAGLSVLLVTMIAATLGSTIPLVLNHFDIDPAVATGVFITSTGEAPGTNRLEICGEMGRVVAENGEILGYPME